jgi:hypothetical protein
MSSVIETELRERCSKNDNLRLLLAQWEYDRLLLTQALTTVGQAFPHYSLHDATHSETILERIAAIVGAVGLNRLSATDLWLLLETAYLHDSGMIVLDAVKRNDLSSAEFEAHLRATTDGPDHDLAIRAARLQDRQLPRDLISILEGHLDLLLVYAEFVRKRHPQRAQEIAVAPFESTRVDSPRTALLPNRLWYMIGQICRAHGENRDFIFRALAFEESGVAGELCHPRFVACMLRLGDLLDLDSGRFCPTLNATISQLPALSEAHRGKHAGIRHLLVCPTRIEVSGVYTDLNVYLEAEQWFTWLREELSAQLIRWDEIGPPNAIGLPGVGSIEARLEGQITLDVAARPRFEVDREKIIELVQGANIYDGPEDAVREVIQNAIDATLLRFSYDAQSSGAPKPTDLDDLRAQLSKYPVDVSLVKMTEQPADPEKVEWLLTVRDRGIGLRIDDARFMLRLGSSKKNPYRRALKSWLPDWARPSGTFGIGFHSLFLYCHEVRVLTRHPDDAEGLDFVFRGKPEAVEPTVVIRRRSRAVGDIAFAPPTGTQVEARFQVDRLARDRTDSMRGRDHQRGPKGYRALVEYDFVLHEELPQAAAAISELAYDMAEGSLCPLQLNLPIAVNNSDRGDDKDVLFRHFDAKEGIEIQILEYGLDCTYMLPRYRGTRVAGWSLSDTTPFQGECGLHTSEADEFLEISRNDFTPDGLSRARERLHRVLQILAPSWLDRLRRSKSPTDRQILPFASLYAMLRDIQPHGDEWRAVPFTSRYTRDSSRTMTLGAIADANTLRVGGWNDSGSSSLHAVMENGTVVLRGTSLNIRKDWLPTFLRKFYSSRRLEAITKGPLKLYRLAKGEPYEDVADDVLVHLLDPPNQQNADRRRSVLPCPRRFTGLAFDLDERDRWLPSDPLILASIANPFIGGASFRPSSSLDERSVEIPQVERYVRWLAKRRSESEAHIAEQLWTFIVYVDHLMQDHWRECKRYDLQVVESDLRRMMK